VLYKSTLYSGIDVNVFQLVYVYKCVHAVLMMWCQVSLVTIKSESVTVIRRQSDTVIRCVATGGSIGRPGPLLRVVHTRWKFCCIL